MLETKVLRGVVKMRQISMRIILAVFAGALVWEGVRSTVAGNIYALLLMLAGILMLLKSRFWA